MQFLPVNSLHYFRYRLGLDTASTQMTEAERALIRDLAPGRKVIVELGTFEGASALLIRKAMDPDAELYCVDPFPPGQLGFSVQLSVSKREINRSKNGRVHLIRQYSYQAMAEWTRTIDLLIMDGDHSFEGASRDFREWGAFVAHGGLIAIHTSRNSPAKPVPDHCGPLRLVNEVMSLDPAFRVDARVDSITVFQKLSI